MSGDIEKIKRVMLERDLKDPSPEVRAERIFSYLQETQPNLTEWDLICFSVNYLALIMPAFPYIEKPIKEIASLIYTAHYSDDGSNTKSGISKSQGDGSSSETNNDDGNNAKSSEST